MRGRPEGRQVLGLHSGHLLPGRDQDDDPTGKRRQACEKGQGHGGSNGAGSDGGEDFGLPKSEMAAGTRG